MSRLIKTGSIAADRKKLMRLLAITMRALMAQGQVDSSTRDMLAFVVLVLEEITASVEKTVAPWEKRDYWLKADQFQREWAWAARLAASLRADLAADAWSEIPVRLAELAGQVHQVEVPQRLKQQHPWIGSWQQLRLRS